MNLFEDPTPIWIAGAVALTFAGVLYYQTASRAAFFSILAILAIVVAGTLVEYSVLTPREQVVKTLHDFADRVETNDRAGILAMIAPTASETQALANLAMDRLEFRTANITGSVDVKLDLASEPNHAVAKFRGFFAAISKRGMGAGSGPFDITVELSREGDRWFVDSYKSTADLRQAINSVR